MDEQLPQGTEQDDQADVEGHARPRPRIGESPEFEMNARPRPRSDEEPDVEGHARPRP